jgi:Zn-dependent protease
LFENLPPPEVMISIIAVLFLGIGLHEYAHCKFADMAGDPTPSFYGRLTLNLTKHFELMGTLMMIFSAMSGYGIGWGKPAPMNPEKMRNPRWDFFIAVIAGPISNLVQAVIYGVLFRLLTGAAPELVLARSIDSPFTSFGYFLYFGVVINCALAIFNLFPFGPLDGHWLLGLLMQEKPRYYWFRFNRVYGRGVLFAVIIFGQYMSQHGQPQFDLFGRYVFPIAERIASLLLGPIVRVMQ